MEESEGKKMEEGNQTKFLAKVPSDWETLSEEERRECSAVLAAQLLERFRTAPS
jgi:hypothetical protein